MPRAAYAIIVEPSLEPPGQDVRSLDDRALARRIAASPAPERGAEAELCRRFAPRIRLYGLRHLRSEAAAADLVQEVLAVTIERLRRGALRDPDQVASFVLGACRLTAQADLRRGARRRAILDAHAAELAPEAAAGPRADLDRLDECLGTLRERERAIVHLTFHAELGAAAIGAELGLTADNVRTLRHRAIVRLRECLGLRGEGGRA